MEQFFQWNENEITIGEPHTSFLENSWDKSNLEFLKPIPSEIYICYGSIYITCHLVTEAKESSIHGNPYSILLPDQFCNLTWKEFMAWRLDNSNQRTSHGSSTGHRGYNQQESRYKSNQNAYQVLAFKKSIKREVSQYTMLKV